MAVNVLQLVIDIQGIPSTTTAVSNYVKNIAILTSPLAGVTEEYVLVSSVTQAATYVADTTNIQKAFNRGATTILLVLEGNITDYSKINFQTYSLLFDAGVDDTVDVSAFNGLVYYTRDAINTTTEALAQQEKRVVVLEPNLDRGLAIELASLLVSGTDYRPIVLQQFTGYSLFFTDNNNEIAVAKQKGFTFLIADNLNVLTPVVWDVFAGGRQARREYIIENAKLDIQTVLYNFIQRNKPNYDNPTIGLMELVAQTEVIDAYIARGLISTNSFIRIPPEGSQTEINKNNGLLANLTIEASSLPNINQIKGTIAE